MRTSDFGDSPSPLSAREQTISGTLLHRCLHASWCRVQLLPLCVNICIRVQLDIARLCDSRLFNSGRRADIATRNWSTPGVERRWVKSIWYVCIFCFLYSSSLCAYRIFYILCIFYIIRSTHTHAYSQLWWICLNCGGSARNTYVYVFYILSMYIFVFQGGRSARDIIIQISVCKCVLYSMDKCV